MTFISTSPKPPQAADLPPAQPSLRAQPLSTTASAPSANSAVIHVKSATPNCAWMRPRTAFGADPDHVDRVIPENLVEIVDGEVVDHRGPPAIRSPSPIGALRRPYPDRKAPIEPASTACWMRA